jgi:hypothetical protein
MRITVALLCSCFATTAAIVPLDVSGVRPGPVLLESRADAVTVKWQDGKGLRWSAEFSLDSDRPLISAISLEGRPILERARPLYRCETGKRRGGWDQFFDYPPSHPEGTRRFEGAFHLLSANARTEGNRLSLTFSGLAMGPFKGSIEYTFFPASRLIQQRALVSTDEQDVAFFYDAGIQVTAEPDRRPGDLMQSRVLFFDTAGALQTRAASGSERVPEKVRYRAIAAQTPSGSFTVFPPPHRYFMPRDYSTNMGFVWHSLWRGWVSLGIRQLPDDNSPFYPWMNAPPGTRQELDLFLLPGGADPEETLEAVLPYTHRDRLVRVEGFKTFSPHWHLAYTPQAMERGLDWTPTFKPVMKDIGIDIAMIMDFHGDGHQKDTGETRMRELKAYYDACRAQSDSEFLLIPAEEFDVHLGGHWGVVFPKQVNWIVKREVSQPMRSTDEKHGVVYRVGSAEDVLRLVREERGYLYQTHPRTKGSTGFPDKIRETEHLRDPRYLGAGWKAMNSDLSSPRLGDRSFKTLDDLNNWGLHKRLINEVDVFQIDSTHELYAHMNINYLRLPTLPRFDDYGVALEALAKGDYFSTTGEILLPKASITAKDDRLQVTTTVDYTFPLRFAEIVWGDGTNTHRETIPLSSTTEFGSANFDWSMDANNWTWARFAIWDVAGNGAYVNPIWNDQSKKHN